MTYAIAAYLCFGLLFQHMMDKQARILRTGWSVGMFLIAVFLWPLLLAYGLSSLSKKGNSDGPKGPRR